MKKVNNSTKAIIRNEKNELLCVKMQMEDGIVYMLPGGTQEPGEGLVDTLKRECLEELGIHVNVHDLCFVMDYQSRRDPKQYVVLHFFRCSLGDGAQVTTGLVPDELQVGWDWLDFDRLERERFFPESLKPCIRGMDQLTTPVYVNDITEDH